MGTFMTFTTYIVILSYLVFRLAVLWNRSDTQIVPITTVNPINFEDPEMVDLFSYGFSFGVNVRGLTNDVGVVKVLNKVRYYNEED